MYDGHDNYAEIARKEVAAGAAAPLVEDNLHLPQIAWTLVSKLQLLIALGVGVLSFYRALVWIGKNVRGELGFAGVGVLLAVMFLGLICAMVFHFATGMILRRLPRWKTLAAIYGVALLAIWVGLGVPIQQGMAANAEKKRLAMERLRQARPPVDGGVAHRHQQWQGRLHRKGAHGAPGVEPPMLTVKDEGATVLIGHNETRPLHVALARVRPSDAVAEVWEGCRMVLVAPDRHFLENWAGQRRMSYRVEPGTMMLFELHPDCAADYADAAIEYRVGVYADNDGWWSDSALAVPLPAYQLEHGAED